MDCCPTCGGAFTSLSAPRVGDAASPFPAVMFQIASCDCGDLPTSPPPPTLTEEAIRAIVRDEIAAAGKAHAEAQVTETVYPSGYGRDRFFGVGSRTRGR